MKKFYSASITPLTAKGEVDVDSLEKLLERNLRHGVDGIFFLGSMGEWSQLLDTQKEQLIKAACSLIGDRAEILAGITGTGLAPVLDNLKKLSKYKIHSYVLMLPSLFLCRIEPVEFILKVAAAADRPVYFYHNPIVTGVRLSADELAPVLAHPNIKGLKNSSGDMTLRKELLIKKIEHDFILLEGNEWAIDEALMIGCDGVLVGLGALGSKLIKNICRAFDAGNYDQARQLQLDLIRIFHGVYGKDFSTVWRGQKYALKKMGIIASDYTPIQSEKVLTSVRKKEIEQCLEKYQSLLD